MRKLLKQLVDSLKRSTSSLMYKNYMAISKEHNCVMISNSRRQTEINAAWDVSLKQINEEWPGPLWEWSHSPHQPDRKHRLCSDSQAPAHCKNPLQLTKLTDLECISMMSNIDNTWAAQISSCCYLILLYIYIYEVLICDIVQLSCL